MPELPEVETVKIALSPAITGKRIRNITINRYDLRFPIPQNFIEMTQGQYVTKTTRRGKYILITLKEQHTIILHLGMSGRIHIHSDPHTHILQKHDHVILEMEDGCTVIFNDPRRFGMLLLADKGQKVSTHPLFAKMGPEPLGDDFNGSILAEKLKGKTATIKSALLDQRVVSGIGNIYACEALFISGIHPERKAKTIKSQEIERLADAIKSTLQKAIEAGGSSLKDYQHTDGSLGYFQTMLNVYDREGQPCRSCKSPVQRMLQSGRSTFYCASCQK